MWLSAIGDYSYTSRGRAPIIAEHQSTQGDRTPAPIASLSIWNSIGLPAVTGPLAGGHNVHSQDRVAPRTDTVGLADFVRQEAKQKGS